LVGMLIACADPAVGRKLSPQFVETPSGLKFLVRQPGNGPIPKTGSTILFHYIGRRADGTIFENSRDTGAPVAYRIGSSADATLGVWREGLPRLRGGDQATFIVPPSLAYGENQYRGNPPNSEVQFDVHIIDIKSKLLSLVLEESINNGGVGAGRAHLDRLRSEGFPDVYTSEHLLNQLGYKYLYILNRPTEGLEVLTWNSEMYPESPNAKDSLAEAYLQNGDAFGAIENYREAIRLASAEQNQGVRVVASAQRTLDRLRGDPAGSIDLVRLELRLQFLSTYGNISVDIPGLAMQARSYLSRATDVEAAERVVDRLFSLAERQFAASGLVGIASSDLSKLETLYSDFSRSHIEVVRNLALQRIQVIKSLTSPLDFTFVDLDGRQVNLKELRGKVVLIEFWSTLCRRCLREMEVLAALEKKYSFEGLQLIGIAYEQRRNPARPEPQQKGPDEVRNFLRQKGITWPQFYDGEYFNNAIGSRFGIKLLPARFILGRDGRIVSSGASAENLEAEIRKALGLL
jgi:thiol-disulfide isomerase/thioredoxin